MKRTLFLGLLLAALTGTTASGDDAYCATPTITWQVGENQDLTWTEYAATDGADTRSKLGSGTPNLSATVVKDGQGTLTITAEDVNAEGSGFNLESGDLRRLIVREGELVLDGQNGQNGSMHLYANTPANAVNVGGKNAALTLKNGAQLSTVYGSGNASSRIGSADGNGTLTVDGQGSIYQVSHCLWVGGYNTEGAWYHGVASYESAESTNLYSNGDYATSYTSGESEVKVSKGVINLTNGGKLLLSDSMGGGATGEFCIYMSEINISGEGSQLSNLGSKSPSTGWAYAGIGLNRAYDGVANDIKLSDGGRMDVKTEIWQGMNAMSTAGGRQVNQISLSGGTTTTTLQAWGVNDTYPIASEGSNGTITPIDPTTVTIPADQRYNVEDIVYCMGYCSDAGGSSNYSGKNTLTIQSEEGKRADFIVNGSLCTGWASNRYYGDGHSTYDVINEISASGAGSHIQVDGDYCNGYVSGGLAWGSYKCESSFTLSDGATANIDGGVYSALVFANTGAENPTIKHDISVQSGASLRIGDVLECMGGNIYTNESIGLTVNLTVTGNGSKLYVGGDAYLGGIASATAKVEDGASAEFAGNVLLSGTATFTNSASTSVTGTLALSDTAKLTSSNGVMTVGVLSIQDSAHAAITGAADTIQISQIVTNFNTAGNDSVSDAMVLTSGGAADLAKSAWSFTLTGDVAQSVDGGGKRWITDMTGITNKVASFYSSTTKNWYQALEESGTGTYIGKVDDATDLGTWTSATVTNTQGTVNEIGKPIEADKNHARVVGDSAADLFVNVETVATTDASATQNGVIQVEVKTESETKQLAVNDAYINNKLTLNKTDLNAQGSVNASGTTINLTQANVSSTALGSVADSTIKGTGTLTNLAINNSKLIAGNSPGVMQLKDDVLTGSNTLGFYVGSEAATKLQGHDDAVALTLDDVVVTSGFIIEIGTVLTGDITLELWTEEGTFAYTQGRIFDTIGDSLQLFKAGADVDLVTALGGANFILGDTFGAATTWSWDTSKLASEGIVYVVVPEPATATLSLLALAGLCARRRRK